MSEHDLSVLGSTIHYRETGAGDPIVFLHGNPTSSYLWRNVIPRLESEGRCLAPDLIGMGASGKPDLEYRFVDHARYLDAWFDALDLRRVTLVVHDWGSALGFHWAARHPDRIAAIAFMEAIVKPLTWAEWPEKARDVFRGFRTPKVGEKMIFEKNVFIENVLPGSIVRRLSPEEMDAYRAPFLDPASRRPVWRWPTCRSGSWPRCVTSRPRSVKKFRRGSPSRIARPSRSWRTRLGRVARRSRGSSRIWRARGSSP